MSTDNPELNHDGSDEEQDLASVEQICEEYIQRHRLGLAPTMESFAQQYPQLEEEILELLPTVMMMEGARLRNLGRRKDGRVVRGSEPILDLGDFKIIRELGRGGMGIVYEAHQHSLDRRVAIKLLPKHMLSDKQVAKFQREASTAAKLHHTHIAPIYGVGESGGFHYYAMQLLDGVALDRYVESSLDTMGNGIVSRPETLTIEEVVEVGHQVALALQYAHDQGVLHRDIKPSNLLRDVNANVWVTDFGLAISREDNSHEHATNASGTIRYMAPEKFDKVLGDVTADVYSLGLTLVELLSGKPAFSSPRISELMNEIKSGAGIKLSHHGVGLPSELESVLRKSISVDPANRYQSAGELAADLENFSEKRPVLANSPSMLRTASAWVKRNPALSLASCLAAGLLVAITVISTVSYFNVQSALAAEHQQLLRSEQTSRVATEAMDEMFGELSGEASLFDGSLELSRSRPQLTVESIALAKQLSDFYHQLAFQQRTDVGLPMKALVARRRVGELNERLGEYQKAAASYRIVLNGYESLMANGELESTTENVLRVASLANRIGLVLRLCDDERASDYHQKAIRLLERNRELNSDVLDNRSILEMARSYYLSVRQLRPGMGPNSFPPAVFSSGFTLKSGAIAEAKLANPGSVEIESAESHDQSIEKAIDMLLRIPAAKGSDEADAADYLLALCYLELSSDDWSKRTEAMIKVQSSAVKLQEALAEKHPDNPVFRFDLMRTLAEISVFEGNLDSAEIDEALQSLTSAREIGFELVKARPDVASYRVELIHCHFKIGRIASLKRSMGSNDLTSEELSDLAELEEQSYRRAMMAQSMLSRMHPESMAYKAWTARFALSLASSYSLRSRPDDRNRLLGRATAILNRLPESVLDQQGMKVLVAESKRLNQQSLLDSDF